MVLDLLDTYELAESFKRGAFRAEFPDYSSIGREVTRAYFRGDQLPSRPPRLVWSAGSQLVDFMPTTATLPYVVSTRFIDLLRMNAVTGWSTHAIELRGKHDEIIDGYYGLVVTGRCGPIQNERARPALVRAPAGHMAKSWFGYYVDEASWDGSEMFAPANTSFIFVLGRVKRLLEAAKLTNITLTPVTEIERIML